MRGVWILPVPFGILDAAVHECLPGYIAHGWVEFTREAITGVSVIYRMRLEKWGNLGDLGTITVRKASEVESILDINDPQRPSMREPNETEIKALDLANLPTREERIAKQLGLLRKLRKETDDLYQQRKQHQRRIIEALFSRLSNVAATEQYWTGQWPDARKGVEAQKSVEDFRTLIHGFKAHVERQSSQDLFFDDRPQESIGRALLQAYLPARGYREVPVRGGQSDLLVLAEPGRFLCETKIWRGQKYYRQGLRELEEYILGESDDQQLLAAFYIVFDPTRTGRARSHLGGDFEIEVVSDQNVEVVVINLALPIPSVK